MSGDSSQAGRGIQRTLGEQPPVFSIAEYEADREQGFLYTAWADGMRGGFAADRFVLMIYSVEACEGQGGAKSTSLGNVAVHTDIRLEDEEE